MHSNNRECLTRYGLWVLIVVAYGGFLIGYYSTVIAGALVFISAELKLSVYQEGAVVSIMILASLFGGLIAGYLADCLGRKKAILISAFFFALGGLILSLSHSYAQLLVGRSVSGFALGIIAVASPIYLAEISPARYRGRCVSAIQLAIATGILVSFIMAYLFSHSASWYALFAVGMYAALAQCLCLFFIPETPSWLILHKKEEQAAKALKRLRSDKLSRNSSRDLFKLDSDKGEWKKMLTPKIIHALVIGLLLTIFQQITGINAVLNYAPKIFQFVGITSTEGCFLATLSVGIISFLATFFSFWVLDKLGRRSLLLVGTAVMAVSLGVLTLGFFMQSTYIDTMAFISLMVYVVAFSISLGPATGVVLSEIFPLKIRANAIALATALNALANYSVNFTFPHLIEKWGGDTTFALFSFLSLLAFLFIWQFLPETKGKSLEEIETMINLGQFKKP